MIKALWPTVFAALLFITACETTTDDPLTPVSADARQAPQARDCDITDQNRALNRDLERAASPGQTLGSVVADRNAEIEALAAAASSGARAQARTPREVACRSIALRAYGALLSSPAPAQRDTAWAQIATIADEGRAACDLLAQRGALDAGASADCDLIDMWYVTGPALAAARSLQAVRSREGLDPAAEATWAEVAALTRDANSAIRGWQSAPAVRTAQMRPVVEEHRRRTVCQVFAPVAALLNLRGGATASYQRLFNTDYPAMIASAAAAVPFPPSAIDQAHAIETFCGPHAQR